MPSLPLPPTSSDPADLSSSSSATPRAQGQVSRSATVAGDLAASDPVLPPPPSFKSVHFAVPGKEEEEEETVPDLLGIPTEGLPTRPASAKPDSKSREER